MSEAAPSDKPLAGNSSEAKSETSPPVESSSSKADAPKRSRAARWRRRILWVLLIGIGLILALRATVRWTLPAALSKAAAPYDLDVRYDRLQLHLLGGDVGLWNVRIVPHGAPDTAEPILHADYVRGDISILALLKGGLHVLRAEVDGADMLLERTADGRIPLIDRFNALPPSPPMTKIDFTPPLVVEALRLHKVRTRVRDAYVNPPTDKIAWLDLRLSDLGTPGGKARFEADAWAADLLDSLHASGSAQLGGQSLDATCQVAMRGLRPKAVAKYLEPLGVRPVADTVSVELRLAAKARPLGAPSTGPTSAPTAQPAQGGRPDAVAASIAVDDVRIMANERDALTVSKLGAEVAELTPTSARVSKVMIDGVRASGSRSSQKLLGAAGFELVTPQATTQPTTRPTAVASGASAPTAAAATPPAPPFALTIAEVDVRDVDATFRDDAVSPPTDLRLVAREFRCKAKDGTNALSPDATLLVVGRLECPGVARLVSIDGELRPQARERTVELKLLAEGIRPEALRPYLDAAGVQSLLNDASARATIRAAITPGGGIDGGGFVANARLSDVALTDGADLLTFGGVNVQNAAVDTAGGRIRVDTIELEGPSLEVRRKSDGAIEAAGVRLAAMKSPAASPAPAAAPAPAPAPAAPSTGADSPPPPEAATQPVVSLPRVEIGRFTWKNVRLKLTDESAQPPSSYEIGDAGIELSDLLLDLQNRAATQPGKPGTLKVWLSAPQLADELNVEGTLVPAAGALAADLRVRGRGVDLTRVAAYLKPLGIEPVLKQGSLDAAIKAEVSGEPDRMRATLDVSGVKLADGERELVVLDGLRVTDAEKTGEGVGVGAVEVVKPRISVRREADGALVAAGIRLRPTTQPAQAQTAAPTTAPVAAAGGAPATQPAPTPLAIALNRLLVDGAELQWEDQAVQPAVHLNATATVNVDQVVLGKAAPPAKFDVTLAAKDALDEMKLSGTVDLTPGAPAAKLHVDGRGLRAGPLAPYLPPGTEVSLVDGRVRADVDAAVTPNPAGGQGFKLDVTDVDYRDGGEGAAGDAPALLALKSFRVAAPRIDLAGDVIAVDEVSLAGFEMRGGKDKDGATRALGLVLRPPKSDAAPAGAPVATTQPAPPAPPTTGPTSAPVTDQEVARLVAEARRPLPLVTLGKLDINASRIEWSDASRPGSKPVVVRDLQLRNVDPVSLGGPRAESQPPVKIEMTTAIDPLTPNVKLLAEAAPFATEPVAKLDLAVAGLTGRAVTDLFPDLATQIDGSRLTDGRFRTQVQAHAKYDRRGPRDFDISRGIQLDVEVKSLALTDGEKGPVLAGVESLQCDALRIEPKTGVVHAKVLEVNKPMATASRDAAGVHLLGLVIKPPAASATQPTAKTPAEKKPAPTPAPTTAPVVAAASSGAPKSEIRVDRLLITGIDVRFEDTTAEPALVVPLNNLDVEVRGFTTLALSEPRPIRFSAVVGADKVPLRKKVKGAGVAGAVGDVAGLVGGKKKETLSNTPEVEQCELFSQITSAGNLTLYPAPAGYVKSSVSGLELAALAGPASQAGVNLSGGVFDTTVEAYFRDDGSLDTRSRFVFTDLSVQEPPNGPIVRHLALPAPLDVVIGALQDTDGSITVPLNVPIEKGKVDKATVTSSAVSALGSIIATAIASAPVKAVEDVGNVIGLGAIFGGDKQKAEIQPVELAFGTGDVTLGPGGQQQIASLVGMMRKDETVELTGRHELGNGDLELARLRANPAPVDALALARATQARKQQLIAARADLAARARVELASLPDNQVSATLDNLRLLDRQIAAADDGADALFDLLRPGAERQSDRRARAAALQLAQQRLATVRDDAVSTAKASNVPLATERIRMTNPQFNPSPDVPAGGKVVVTVVRKKRQ